MMCGIRRSMADKARETRVRMDGQASDKQLQVISDVSGASLTDLRGTPKWLASFFIDSIVTESGDPDFINSWELRT